MIQNKHIIRLLFIGLFLSIVASIILYRYFMIEQIILEQVTTQNERIAEIYKKQIWNTHKAAIAKLKVTNYKDLLNDDDFIKFAKHTIDFFKSTNSYISLFDMHGNKFIANEDITITPIEYYDTDNFYNIIFAKFDRYFLKNYIISRNFSSSFQGKTNHFLFPKSIVNQGEHNTTRAAIITSFIPVIDDNFGDFLVDGLLEINTNVSKQWENISLLEKRVFITFITIFSVFFIIVMFNTNYAQSIINKQFETNRELGEAKLRAESESTAKTEFLANVSHELRTPLNAIIGFSEMMIAETYGRIENAQYRDYINDINNSGKHLLSVINDILDFSKASADKLKVEQVELDLNKLASSSMRFVKPRADDAKVQLLEDIPKEHIVITADPKRLKQALLNLLSNSVKFTPENGSVTMKIEKDEVARLVYIKVIDTGIGMSEKDIPKALASFGQVDNKLSRKYEGTGLGLPLTKKLVELMSGKFDIYSEVGVGTTVILTFKYDDSISI